MAGYTSIFGKRLILGPNGLIVDGAPVGRPYGGRGRLFYVDSQVAAAGGQSPDEAVGTINAGIALCSANRGDTVVVMPNHSETITGAAAIAHSIAGVSVVGMTWAGRRPRITYASAATTYAITADDAYVCGIRFISNFADVTAAITTTKQRTWIDNCRFMNTTSVKGFATPIKATSTTNNDSDGLVVTGCRWVTTETTDLEMIEINANISELQVLDNYAFTLGTASPLILVAAGKLLAGADIGRNKLFNSMTANELFISNDGTTNTGLIYDNYCGHKDVTGTHDAGWDSGGFRLFNNLSVSTDALSGFVVPAIDVNL